MKEASNTLTYAAITWTFLFSGFMLPGIHTPVQHQIGMLMFILDVMLLLAALILRLWILWRG